MKSQSGSIPLRHAAPLVLIALLAVAVGAIFMLAIDRGGGHASSGPKTPIAARRQTAIDARLDRALAQTLRANPSFPAVALAVRTPTLDWAGAAGVADRSSGRPLETDATFRIASVTKTFTAAAVLRLVEQGQLELDDTVSKHLSGSSVALLRSGGYDADAMRVRDLLQHTSGLAGDYAEMPAYVGFVVAHPRHRWTRTEQIRFVMTHSRPLSRPGAEYHYSDTGYILLGEILERQTRAGLASAYRTLLGFDRLGLDETYLETREPIPAAAKPRAHQYLGALDMTAHDPSFDIHGAGGHVSSLDDLARFYRALLEQRVFERPETLRAMLGKPNPTTPRELPMGIDRAPLGGETCFGHAGFWGVAAYHCPRSKITIVSSITQAEGFMPATARLLTMAHPLASRPA